LDAEEAPDISLMIRKHLDREKGLNVGQVATSTSIIATQPNYK
jgi:hypothetical protein